MASAAGRTVPRESFSTFEAGRRAMSVPDTPSSPAADGTAAVARTPSEVQLKMARAIVEYLCRNNVNVGNHVTEQELVEEFRISRSPVRAAMSYLAERGVFEQRPNRGFFVKLDGSSLRKLSLEMPRTDEEKLLGAIAQDWFAGRVPQSFSEAEFCRRYRLGRSVATRVLFKLSDDGIILRNRGHGWRFEPSLHTPATRDESYAFRIVVEPAAILSPSFELDRGMAELCRRHHEIVLNPAPQDTSLTTLSDIDIEFHRMIGVSSRNRFFLAAIEQQNSLRRVTAYANWNKARLFGSCVGGHMEILAALERDEREEAAELMRHNLVSAHNYNRRLQPNEAG
jgi:DNA-binding GntR family transcriptional regulator